jgi:hypothetical protein
MILNGKHIRTNINSFITESLSNPKLNKILDKISELGLDSLSEHEKTLLKSYSDKNIDVEKEIIKHQNKFRTAKEILKVVPLETSNVDLEKNIGRFVKLKPNDSNGLIANRGAIYEIVAIQKHWGHVDGKYVDNKVGYRIALVGDDNDFGRVGDVDEIIFVNVSEDEAIKINKDIFKKIKKYF